jgi:hypothetical protein
MVWALKEPDGFGDYWPDGTLDSFKVEIERYFNEQMSERERAQFDGWYIKYWAQIFEKLIKDGGPLLPHECPAEFETTRGYNSLASIIETEGRLLAVDGQLKALIESFEPGLHQFWPIRIKMPKNAIYPVQYYGLRIGQFLDSYLPVEGTFSPYHGGGKLYFSIDEKKSTYAKLQFSEKTVGNSHLWRESKLITPNIFLSDALQAAIAEAGLRIFRHYKVKVV